MRSILLLLVMLGLCDPALAGEIEIDLQCLRQVYAQDIMETQSDAAGRVWLVLRGGARVLYDAPQADQLYDPLSSLATVRQSMAQRYPLEPDRPVPEQGVHPGRVRSYALLQALYGAGPKAVRKGLRMVDVAGQHAPFASAAGAANALGNVGALLRQTLQRQPQYGQWVFPLGGSFKWRGIAGERRLSPHSFGIAVDLNPRQGAYWRWSGGTTHPGQKLYPPEIVAAFEKNGFVWGGKWHEYDLMHFEYRPEIICKAQKLRQEERARQTLESAE